MAQIKPGDPGTLTIMMLLAAQIALLAYEPTQLNYNRGAKRPLNLVE
jgi:hypothetical protein